MAVNVNHPEPENWKTIIPEGPDTISQISCVNDQFVVQYMHDAHDVMKLYGMDGKLIREIELPGIGSVGQVSGKRRDGEMYFSFSSFIIPPTIYRYNFASAELEPFRKPEVKFDSSRYETRQIFVTSKDGTKVPMFLTHRKDISLDGTNPTILNAYGGFNVSTLPGFNALKIVWLEQGGVLANANLRGGGEYGEAWHEGGMREKKQNVFDDFRAAQWLIDNKYTSTKRPGDPGRKQRRAARQRRRSAMAGPVRRGAVSRAADRYAAVSPLHSRSILGPRIRRRGRGEASSSHGSAPIRRCTTFATARSIRRR